MARIAFGEPLDNVDEDYLRCNWVIQLGSSDFLCLLLPHEGIEHKVMDGLGQIRTVEVRKR